MDRDITLRNLTDGEDGKTLVGLEGANDPHGGGFGFGVASLRYLTYVGFLYLGVEGPA